MPVTVRLFAALREHLGSGQVDVDLQAGDTPGLLFDRLFAGADVHGLRGSLLFAVNRDYVEADHPLDNGDEVAFIPPLGGGAPQADELERDPRVHLSIEPLRLGPLLDQVRDPGRGGIATFTGSVRNHFEGRPVEHLDYEAYEEMVLPKMLAICDAIEARWPGSAAAISHRIGRLEVGEDAVHIVVGAAHRDAAFAACRYGIDELKATVPIFKKEVYQDGSEWKAQGGG